jgi:hypothetical protein
MLSLVRFYGPVNSEDSDDDDDVRPWTLPATVYIENAGSTARDGLARERNYTTALRFAIALCTVGAAFLLRFRLRGTEDTAAPTEGYLRWTFGVRNRFGPRTASN